MKSRSPSAPYDRVRSPGDAPPAAADENPFGTSLLEKAGLQRRRDETRKRQSSPREPHPPLPENFSERERRHEVARGRRPSVPLYRGGRMGVKLLRRIGHRPLWLSSSQGDRPSSAAGAAPCPVQRTAGRRRHSSLSNLEKLPATDFWNRRCGLPLFIARSAVEAGWRGDFHAGPRSNARRVQWTSLRAASGEASSPAGPGPCRPGRGSSHWFPGKHSALPCTGEPTTRDALSRSSIRSHLLPEPIPRGPSPKKRVRLKKNHDHPSAPNRPHPRGISDLADLSTDERVSGKGLTRQRTVITDDSALVVDETDCSPAAGCCGPSAPTTARGNFPRCPRMHRPEARPRSGPFDAERRGGRRPGPRPPRRRPGRLDRADRTPPLDALARPGGGTPPHRFQRRPGGHRRLSTDPRSSRH